MLTRRRASILKMVVSEYVATAEPVSSRALVERHRLRVSTATIRNELARLEDEGFITHPHTSAGRVPSDMGYRHYVEALMSEEPVGEEEQRTIEHQLYQVPGGLDEWLSLSATILSSTVENVAVVTRPRAASCRLRHVQLVELHGETALLVAVMDDGRVRQRIVQLSAVASQQELNERAQALNARLAGAGAVRARRLANEFHDRDDVLVANAVADFIEEQRIAEETFVDGIAAVLRQPEFATPERMLQAVQQLGAYQVRHLLEQAMAAETGAVRVVIGHELGDEALHDWSVIVTNYGDREGGIGTVAVLGPTRMRYERTIPRVRYVADLMGNLLQEVR